MHQTFYIDDDEEIISIINKIKKSPLAENILVVPQRALILQSIINLKLLKKESEKLNKQIMIVTKDQQGQKLVEKSGILVQSSLDELERSEELKEDLHPRIKNEQSKSVTKEIAPREKLKNIGSESFFNGYAKNSGIGHKDAPKNINEPPKAKDETKKSEKRTSAFDISKSESAMAPPKIIQPESNVWHQEDKANSRKEREIEKLFGERGDKGSETETEPKKEKKEFISGKIKKLCFVFTAACLLVILALGAYLIFPKAKIGVLLKTDTLEKDITAEGDSRISTPDPEANIIPAVVIKKKSELVLPFKSTGKTVISDQKARGMLTIYNEYDKSPQPLVATTRFLDPDGKLFRLTKGVIVPGMTEVSGELKAGVIEAEVIADEPGEEHNIDPCDFSIPGFKGSPKYEKFYARSSQAMVGGGLSGNEVTVVSQEDIDLAKTEVESELEGKIKKEIIGEAGEGKIILEEALEKDILNSSSSIKSETVTDTFEYRAEMEIKAIVFSQKDMAEIIENTLKKKIKESKSKLDLSDKIKVEIFEIEAEYGQPDVDSESGKISIKVHGKGTLKPEINLENFKKDLLGKNDEQVKEILKNYSQVKEVEIEYWPKFFSKKIPSYGKRVEIEIISEI